MQPTTNLRIITIVVLSIATDSLIGIATLAYCMVIQIKPDPTLITAFVGITSGLVGALTGLLVNTRTQTEHGTNNPVSVQVENKGEKEAIPTDPHPNP